MKLAFKCFQCQINKEVELKDYFFELRDDNTYLVKCEKGHESIVFFESHKFELLFEMGIYALLDGYFREAVSNFAASIERFYEFSIEVFVKRLVEGQTTKFNTWITHDTEPFNKSWKLISNQSERQLGAYVMLYLANFNNPPELMKQNNVEFRNKVIHKGYFPTEEETLKYAEDIFCYLKSKIIELKQQKDDYVSYIYDKKMREYIESEDVNGKNIVQWGENMTFRTLRVLDEIKGLEFNNIIEERKQQGYKLFKS